MSKKQFATKFLHATILTVYTAGSLHLLMVFIAGIKYGDLSFINPINILGLQLVFPHLAANLTALVVGWLALVGLGLLYLFLLIHYKRYLAIISATGPYQRMKRISQMTREIQAVLLDLSQFSGASRADKRTLRVRLVDIITKYQAGDD